MQQRKGFHSMKYIRPIWLTLLAVGVFYLFEDASLEWKLGGLTLLIMAIHIKSEVRVDDLKIEVSVLTNEIDSLEGEISSLQNQIRNIRKQSNILYNKIENKN